MCANQSILAAQVIVDYIINILVDDGGQNKLLETKDWVEILSHIINCINLEQFEEVERRIF